MRWCLQVVGPRFGERGHKTHHVTALYLRQRQGQMVSLAGAAHLLKNNAGVQRATQWEQKSHVEQKGKSCLDLDFQYECKP